MIKKTILFIYTGYEQGSWGNTAFSWPSHYYIMPGILYCASALKNDPLISSNCDIHYRYFNRTVESIDAIYNTITQNPWDVVGFSTYCWNAVDHFTVAQKLKIVHPRTKIIFGGPEVVLENGQESASFFDRHPYIDCVVSSDAEKKLPALVRSLLFNEQNDSEMSLCKGFIYNPAVRAESNYDMEPAVDLNTIPSIIPFTVSVKRSETCGLAMVYETGRGCPNRCIFCKFGHRSTRAVRIAINRAEKELAWLLEQGIECIHFADAVFDQNPEYAKQICAIILKHNRQTSIFFYCSLFKLDEELAALFAGTQSQICVGIQSTNPEVLRTLRRAHNPVLLDKTASLLQRFDINFYTDLIFGLPKDNMESFARSFNQVAAINPAFIMLFPLSLIKGTELADQSEQYGILPYPREKIRQLNLMCDISYENIGLYRDFKEKDLEIFDDVTLTVFYFYNRFYFSLSHLVKRSSQTPFALFRQIGEKTKKYLKETGLRASNTSQMQGFEDVLFALFSDILCRENAAENELKAFKELFNIDILRIILLTSSQRIKIFRSLTDKKQDGTPASFSCANDNYRAQRSSHGKIVTIPYALQDLFNLHLLKDAIARIPAQLFIHAPFNAWNVKIEQISPLERFCIEYIPENRGVRINTIVQAAMRQFRPAPGESVTITPETVQKTLKSLFAREIILLY